MIIPVNLVTKLYFKHGNGTRGLVFYDASKVAQCKREVVQPGWLAEDAIPAQRYFDKKLAKSCSIVYIGQILDTRK